MTAGSICLIHAFFLSILLHRSSQVDHRGKEFLVSFLPQHPQQPHNGTNRLYISSFEDTRVRVQAPFLALDKSYHVTSGGMRIITLPGSARADGFTGNEKKGIRLTSDKPVSVQGLQVLRYSGEGFLGLPVDLLGKDYMVPTYPPAISAMAQVVAGEDNTVVSFRLRLPPGGRVKYGDTDYGDGSYINETLNKLEIFHVLADSDLSGTRITSSKPVAVFSGNDCARVPSNPCNHLVEQIPPISSWGTQFITSPVLNNQAGSTFHVLASEANTLVYVDSHWKTVLSEGETYEIDSAWNQSLVIRTSHPSLVVQYHKGVARPSRSPFMALVPPVSWFSNDYTIYVPLDENRKAFDSYMNVIIDTSQRDGLRVKANLAPQFSWEQISGSGYSRASLHLSRAGIYHVYHENPLTNFSSLLHGAAMVKWFAYPAGMKFVPPDPSCAPTLTVGGDERDNDCDGRTDEERANGLDDDGDGRIDEDLVTPVPEFLKPNDIVDTPLVSCDSSSNVADSSNTGFASGSAKGVCKVRGKWTILSKDNVGNFQDCIQEFDRVWTMRDACQNVLTKTQRIKIRTAEVPQIQFPAEVTITCREIKYLQPSISGKVGVWANSCPRKATISFQDKLSDCKNSEGRLTRSWTVVDECRKKTSGVQIIKLLPTGTRKTTNYVVLFRITNEEFSHDLKDSSSPAFKRLADNLDREMKEKFYGSTFGRLFVAAHVIHFGNGSVVPRMVVKMDALAQVDQRQLADFLNNSLQNGTLGNYEVDPRSVRIEDFDECQARNLNDCHEKAICTNILGSFKCTCRDGYFGNGRVCQTPPSIFHYDAALQAGTKENVTLVCHARGVPAPEFTWMTPQGIVNGTSSIYEKEYLDDGSFRTRGKILQDDGSLLVFNTRVYDKGSYTCVAVNVMGKDERTVNLTVSRDIVEVDVAITIKDRVFDKELENKSSAKYQAMEKEVKEELTLLFQDTEGFDRIEIVGFTNGSVKVRFRVIIKVDKAKDKNPEVIATKVGRTLQVSVKNGRVGSLQVAPVVELKEIPPPPVNVKASDIKQTEAAITWSHPDLHEMFAINSYLLQFKKFGTSTWRTFAAAKGENHKLYNLDHDTAYMVRLKSRNELGVGEPSENLELLTLKKKSSTGLVLGIVISLVILIMLAIAGFFLYKRWKNKRKRGHYQTDEAIPMNPLSTEQPRPEAASDGFLTLGSGRYAPVPGFGENGLNAIKIEASFTWREIPRDRVTIGKVLGEGEFGMVVRGEFTEEDGSKLPCAVKKLKRTATESDLKDLLNELEIMTAVGKHPNLVNLIGACSIGGPLMMVVEFAEHGNLLHHLRERRKQNYEDMNEYSLEISSSERLRMACDVSEGMKHLAKMKCAHRDLAARNVLLGEGMVAKVSDFGLSRDIYTDNVYEKKTGGKLPAKWMAMESLEFGINTSQSDVWSFGVLLWEIETGGCVPYAGMVLNELLSKLKGGKRLEKPRYCSDWLYALMRRCWKPNPNERPTFEDISDELHRMLKLETDYLTPEEYRLEPVYANDTFENVSLA